MSCQYIINATLTKKNKLSQLMLCKFGQNILKNTKTRFTLIIIQELNPYFFRNRGINYKI